VTEPLGLSASEWWSSSRPRPQRWKPRGSIHDTNTSSVVSIPSIHPLWIVDAISIAGRATIPTPSSSPIA